MKSNTKYILGTFLKSFVNNEAAIEGAKKAPWWIGVVMAASAILLPLVPVTVTTLQSKGSGTIGSATAGLDTHITESALALKENGYKFNVKNHTVTMTINGIEQSQFEDDQAFQPIHTYVSQRKEMIVNEDGTRTQTENLIYQKDFEVYYSAREYSSKDIAQTADKIIEAASKKQYILGKTDPKTTEDPEGTKYYTPSFMVIYSTGIYVANYTQDSSTIVGATTFSSDWKNTKDCELLTRILEVNDVAAVDAKHTNVKYVEGVYKNFKGIIDETYQNAKLITWRNVTLIYGGVYLALIFLLGFMLWLLTRGKNNPFNYLKWWTTTKIAFWSSLSPAILGLIGGFIFSQYAPFIFIIFLGLRVMWLSMKNLRPAY